MLVSATEMLQKAEAGHYGIGAFNINNLEWTKSILQAAEETDSPVILQCSSGAGKYMGGWKTVVDLVKDLYDYMDITVPVALHLDHGTYEAAKACLAAGFTSIMYDGSQEETFELNYERTKELVALAHSKGVSIEAEVGGIGGTEDGVTSRGECADPAECKKIADLGVDFLACGIGNIHGVYPADWEGLQFDVLAAIKKEVGDLPLVLHGGSGIPEDQIKRAISEGVSKINVNTENQLVFAAATRAYIEAGKDKEGKGFDPRKLLKPGADAVVDMVKEKIRMFGSEGKGWA
jgi:fructose-bisphosphate aldolase class II